MSFVVCLGVSLLFSATARADDFWKHWGDGRAEMNGYALIQPRYGQARGGTAVLIFVTEDFSDSLRVKADPGKHPPSDVVPVMKLNFVRDFQTGIYDYNVLTSTFARIADGFPVLKTSFSSQEWCGHVYQQWLIRNGQMTGTAHSYFDGEADQTPSLPFPTGGIVEDQLPILLRGLRGAYLAPGESRAVPFLPSTLRARFSHRAQAWGQATVTRDRQTRKLKSALGAIDAFEYVVSEKAGETTTYTIEAAEPHRLLGWRSAGGEVGTLLGSTRLAYWTLNQEGGEAHLKELGLAVPAATAKPPSR